MGGSTIQRGVSIPPRKTTFLCKVRGGLPDDLLPIEKERGTGTPESAPGIGKWKPWHSC